MSTLRFVAGIALCFVALVPIVLAADAARRIAFPSWRGLPVVLIDVVFALSATTIVTQILGAVGLFSTAFVTIALAMCGGLAWVWLRRRARPAIAVDHDPPGQPTAEREAGRKVRTWQLTLASVGILVVAVAWIGRTTGGIARGMRTIDTLWYHLPVAARFVQLHRVTEIHFLDDDPVSSYFPWNSSLLHAVGMLFFGSDLVSTIVNVGWFALAIAAAWAAGRPWGVGPASALGMTFVLATPGIVETQPGGAYVDVVGLALLMTAIAIALQGTPSPRTVSQDLVAALACGLAAGTKFTFLAPAAAICLGLAVTSPRGARLRHTWVIAAGAIATSVCWYARNTIATRNPLPNFSADLGPLCFRH